MLTIHEKEEAHILRVGIKSVRINVKKPRKGLSSPPQENFWGFMLKVKFHQASRKVYQNIPSRKVFIFLWSGQSEVLWKAHWH